VLFILSLLPVSSYGTEFRFRELTEGERRSIQQESCDVITKEINAGFFRDILLFSDSSQLKLLENFGMSDTSYYDTGKIINITKCEIEIFLDSIVFHKVMENILVKKLKLRNTNIKLFVPENIRVDTFVNYTAQNEKRIKYPVYECEIGQIILELANSDIVVRQEKNVVYGSRLLRVKIKHGRYLEAKKHKK
jgi:hypothetical protein